MKKQVFLSISKWALFGLVLLLLYFPLIYIIIQSFNSSATGTRLEGFTLKWYAKVFSDRDLIKAIGVSISMALISTFLSVVFGTIAVVGINSLNRKARRRVMLINSIPVLNADIVTGVFLMLFFQFVMLVMPGVQVFGYTTMLLAHVFFSTPYVVLSVLPKFREIDPNLYDAALDLGCRPREALIKVILPSLKTGIIAGALIAFTMSIDDFVISYMTSGNGVQNFSMWLYSIKTPLKNNAMQKASAYNTLVSLVSLALLVAYNIYTRFKGKNKKNEKNY